MTLPLRTSLVAVLGLAAALLTGWAAADRSSATVDRGIEVGDNDPTVSGAVEEGPAGDPAAAVTATSVTPAGVTGRPTPQAAPAIGSPVRGPVSSPFGWRRHPVSGRARHHDGVDLAVPLGTPVRAVAPGRVRAVGPRPGYGLVVELDHPATPSRPAVRTVYAHLSAVDEALRPGARVGRGRAVGASGGRPGRDGVSTGPHLHFEVRDGAGQPLDPGHLSRAVPAVGTWRARPSGPPPGFRYRTAADERAMAHEVRPPDARRDTVDVWPTAGSAVAHERALPAVALPDYPAPSRAPSPTRPPSAEVVPAPAPGPARSGPNG